MPDSTESPQSARLQVQSVIAMPMEPLLATRPQTEPELMVAIEALLVERADVSDPELLARIDAQVDTLEALLHAILSPHGPPMARSYLAPDETLFSFCGEDVQVYGLDGSEALVSIASIQAFVVYLAESPAPSPARIESDPDGHPSEGTGQV